LDTEATAKITSSNELNEQNIRIFQKYCNLSNYKKQKYAQSYVGLSFETCMR